MALIPVETYSGSEDLLHFARLEKWTPYNRQTTPPPKKNPGEKESELMCK